MVELLYKGYECATWCATMGKYDFRLSGEEEARLLEMFESLPYLKKSSVIRLLITEGIKTRITNGALEAFQREQTIGWEIRDTPPKDIAQYHVDFDGKYHIPFKLLQKSNGPSLRDLIKIRDGDKCRKCSSVENIQLYRIDGDQTNNTLENLITLCRPCIKASQKFMLIKERRKLFAIWFYLGRNENI